MILYVSIYVFLGLATSMALCTPNNLAGVIAAIVVAITWPLFWASRLIYKVLN
jgi:hypothetical protein